LLNKKLEEKKVIRDNIHGNIQIEYKIIMDLINTDIFQRLRRIRQLGGTFIVFPSSEHSRFVHSLGVYALIKKIVEEVDDLKANLSEREKIIVMVAGLLHDIGHGPLSHAFEEVFHTNHELMSIKMIQEDTSITRVLESYEKNLSKEVASIISKSHPNSLLVQLVSSQLDADRMDYLLRDAYNCGVSYGNFDLGRVLKSMCVLDNKIVFKESGVHAIEDYIFARYHMYWQVYLHPAATAYEIIYAKVMHRFKQLCEEGYTFNYPVNLLKPLLNKDVSVQDYFKLDDYSIYYFIEQFQYEEDEILSELASCFINRKLFKYLDTNDLDKAKSLVMQCERDPLKQDYYFENREVSSSFYKYYGHLNTQAIIVKMKDNSLEELYNASPLVNAIVQSAKKKTDSKLYYHRQYLDKMKELSNETS